MDFKGEQNMICHINFFLQNFQHQELNLRRVNLTLAKNINKISQDHNSRLANQFLLNLNSISNSNPKPNAPSPPLHRVIPL